MNNFPRVTEEEVEASIREEYYFPRCGETFMCVITPYGGLPVTGEFVFGVDEEVDEEKGKQLARKQALEKVRMYLEGKLSTVNKEVLEKEGAELNNRILRLATFLNSVRLSDTKIKLCTTEVKKMEDLLLRMRMYASILQERIRSFG